MGRRLFLQHLAEAATFSPTEITQVDNPEEGVISFKFSHCNHGEMQPCDIRLLALDVDEYPDGNTYMLYTEDDQADPRFTKTFDALTSSLGGKSLADALQRVSTALIASLDKGLESDPFIAQDSDESQVEEEDQDDFFLGDDDDDNFFGVQAAPAPRLGRVESSDHSMSRTSSTNTPRDKIRSDLRAAKRAGFKVGIIGDLEATSIVCLSIRTSKLGISDEVMEAWSLNRSQYFLLMIRFSHGYRTLEDVKEDANLTGRTEMRVALCTTYKPSREDALTAFNQVVSVEAKGHNKHKSELTSLFIGGPLNDLLRDRFTKIIKYREGCAFNWPSAEAFVHEIQGKTVSAVDNLKIDDFYISEKARALPSIVTDDAMERKLLKHVSLPLVAMQFALRHFVRCTEFCLVCHCPVNDTFEALKPYVCNKPLCLYQYMALGFGPTIEWDVESQQYVVDLLVSFCYLAAAHNRLKEFPQGINLKVPLLPHFNNPLASFHQYGPYNARSASNVQTTDEDSKPSFSAKFDTNTNTLVLSTSTEVNGPKLRTSDWVVLLHKSETNPHYFHHRVQNATSPVFQLSPPLIVTTATATGITGSRSDNVVTAAVEEALSFVDCYIYERNFDDLTSEQKCHGIATLLDTLPTVREMRHFLRSSDSKGKEPSLRYWKDRISDPALNLFRWIIASNRSCIMQIDKFDGETGPTERVPGMDGYLQFKFAQGAPDKEQRFIDAVNQQQQESSSMYPTLFAWHGSSLANWHSIIRQGLRADEVLHGRAYGNGVYMSNQLNTSISYSSYSSLGLGWTKSVLKLVSAVSLQEVVNRADKFVSQAPHYVVANIDWIQTRYMFIKSEDLKPSSTSEAKVSYEQDPSRSVNGESGPIKIPITAISKSRRPTTGSKAVLNGNKKSKSLMVTDQASLEKQEDDENSVVSDLEDREALESDEDEKNDDADRMSVDLEEFQEKVLRPLVTNVDRSKKRGVDASQTDFVPGSLDVSKIKFLDPPTDASVTASKALMQALKTAVKTQESMPLRELGWYINQEHVNSIYQWIVELHTFDANIPLAKDMKQVGLSSIVLEMRFTKNYPFTPPFIRVVSPRFLPFNSGGGGHITEGGAICMELLTNTGWSAVTSIESVLLQVRLAISDEERPARLLHRGGDKSRGREMAGSGSMRDSYGVGEAVAAYERACRAHGWKVPEGFSTLMLGGE